MLSPAQSPGTLQVLVLVIVPPPQLALQLPQSPQSCHSPGSASIYNIGRYSKNTERLTEWIDTFQFWHENRVWNFNQTVSVRGNLNDMSSFDSKLMLIKSISIWNLLQLPRPRYALTVKLMNRDTQDMVLKAYTSSGDSGENAYFRQNIRCLTFVQWMAETALTNVLNWRLAPQPFCMTQIINRC